MANTFTKIATLTGSTPTNVVTFNSIPQTYTDLKLVVSARITGTTANQGFYIQFSGSGSGYSYTQQIGTGASHSSDRASSANAVTSTEVPNDLNTSGFYSNTEFYIPNYSVTSSGKSMIIDSVKHGNTASTAVYLQSRAALWNVNTAITSMAIGTNVAAPNYFGPSTFTLYGINKNA